MIAKRLLSQTNALLKSGGIKAFMKMADYAEEAGKKDPILGRRIMSWADILFRAGQAGDHLIKKLVWYAGRYESDSYAMCLVVDVELEDQLLNSPDFSYIYHSRRGRGNNTGYDYKIKNGDENAPKIELYPWPHWAYTNDF